ncbi:MAG: FAD-binding oxidoreductase [Planctomycetes bacterium]|nr:FAD-binding oxidoreductase [Planctomycetota bacterium]
MIESLATRIDPCAILDPSACERFAVEGRRPSVAVRPGTVEEVSRVLRWARDQRFGVVPWGNGTLMHLGFPPERYDLALQLDRLNRVVDYPSADMTITVQAGLCLGSLQRILGEHRQYLPIDPPNAGQATIGGLIAANAGGPRRHSEGTLRDMVIGIQVVQADGSVVKGGSRVVKNVAGYDLCKLYTGSFGTLGVIIETTLKLRLLPEIEASVWCEVESPAEAESVVAAVLDSELCPVFLEYLNGAGARAVGPAECHGWALGRPAVLAGLDGPLEAAQWQKDRLRAILESRRARPGLELADDVQKSVRDRLFQFRSPPGHALVAKANVLSSEVTRFIERAEQAVSAAGIPVEAQAHAASGIVYLRSRAAPPCEAQVSAVQVWAKLAAEAGGCLVMERSDPEVKARLDVWGPPRSDFALQKAIKQMLDPHRVLNPGRFIGRL